MAGDKPQPKQKERTMTRYSILAAVLLLSACGGQFGDTNHVGDETADTIQTEETNQTLNEWSRITEPYFAVIPQGTMVGDTSRPWITFDYDAAIEAGIEPKAIAFAEKLLQTTQQVLQREAILDGELKLDPMIEQFFESYGTTTEASHQSEENGIGVLRQAAHCGGSRGTPWRCDAFLHQNQTWQTDQEVRTLLLNANYHLTARYAVLRDSEYGNDYTLPVLLPCGQGVFRVEAGIYRRDNQWTYKLQHDLNPEVLNDPLVGDWPHWWWPTYVAWWHWWWC